MPELGLYDPRLPSLHWPSDFPLECLSLLAPRSMNKGRNKRASFPSRHALQVSLILIPVKCPSSLPQPGRADRAPQTMLALPSLGSALRKQ